MRIIRIPKIKGYRIFRDFTWPSELHPFAQFNVIYGWNGSGKTAFSTLFEGLQKKQSITEGKVEFEFDTGLKIAGENIPDNNLPPVRVFNRDFVAKTIESISVGNVLPIYYLGEESVEQQKQVEKLKKELIAAQEAVNKANTIKTKAEKEFDYFCIENAKLIKEALLGSADHATYDKRDFRRAVTRLKGKSTKPTALSDKDKEALRKKKELQAKPSISKVVVSIPDIDHLRSQTTELLQQTIISKVIDELANDSTVGAWVQQGLTLHKDERETDICRFCGNTFSPERRTELEAHFNDAFAAFQQGIKRVISDIERQQEFLKGAEFPDVSRFYDHLAGNFQPAVEAAKKAIQSVNQVLSCFIAALEQKKAAPFKEVLLQEPNTAQGVGDNQIKGAIDSVNLIIEKHEETTTNLNGEIRNACSELEQDYVLGALEKYDALNSAVTSADAALSFIRQKPSELQREISAIERKIIEHRRPAEELTCELRAYLGRDELAFEVEDTGYVLSRSGQPALNLSEGERTAIAFLYFLKSLEDRGFDRSKGIVVIDDPVSSLDANALFSAFGYMKERTKECHQLFILTHNFSFFRQVKNWYHHLKGQNKKRVEQRPGRFYALVAACADGQRNAVLSHLDRLLKDYESEYHFLFRQVYDVANDAVPNAELSSYYGIPNIARRLIETFLAYRFPDGERELIKKLDRVNFEPTKKTRILRLLHTCSHSGGITEPEHDPSMLAETGEVMKIILELIQAVDKDHYQGMINCMQPVEAEE